MKWQLYKAQLRDGCIRSLILLVLIGLMFILKDTAFFGFIILGIYGVFVFDFVLTVKELASRKFKLFGLAPVSSLQYVVPMVIRYLITAFLAMFLAFTLTFSIIPGEFENVTQYSYLVPIVSLSFAFSLMHSVLFFTLVVLLIRSTLLSQIQMPFIRIVLGIIVGYLIDLLSTQIIRTLFGFSNSFEYILSRAITGIVDTGVAMTLIVATAVVSLLFIGGICLLREKYLDY